MNKLLLLALLCALAACGREPQPGGAAEASAEALMAAVFPGWTKTTPVSAHLRWSEADEAGTQREAEGWVLVEPALVAQLDPEHVLLVVAGKPSDEGGNDVASHASGGNLGAYWFARRGGQWQLSAAQPSFAWTGFFGDPGSLRHLLLGAGHQALAVENGSCWQGQCGQWLELYEIGDSRVVPLLAGKDAVALEEDSSGATDSCPELLALPAGTRKRVQLDEYSANAGCEQVHSRWAIKAGEQGPGDLEISFSGKRLVVEGEAPAAASAPVASASAASAPAVAQTVLVQPVQATLVYRFRAGRYEVLSGENPVPGF